MPPPKGLDIAALSTRLASMGIPQEFSQSLLQDPNLLKRIMNDPNTRRSMGASSSVDGALSQMQENLKMMISTNARERSLPPMKIPPRKKDELLSGFVVYEEPKRSEDDSVEIKTTVIGLPWSYSQTNLSELKRTSLRNLLVRKTHKGFFVLGRVVSEISKINSINMIFEDPDGYATLLSIYNYPTSFQSNIDAMQPIFSKGSVWAIREPTYKLSQNGTSAMIRIDAPSDIVSIASDDDLLRDVKWSSGATPITPRPLASVEKCRSKGAEEFKGQRWLAAAVCYTDGLNFDKHSLIMRLNRSETYIRLGWYNSALHDAEQAIESGIEDATLLRKAIFRATRASYYISDYERAIQYADRIPEDKDCTEWKTKAKSRMQERDTGSYDWCTLYRESQTERSRPDVADFCGPVEVRKGGDDGIRGLFATRDVKLGELLLVSKPIASYYEKDNPRHKAEMFKSMNLLTNEMTGRDRPAIIATVAQKMWDDERLATLIQSMYAGPDGPSPQPFVSSSPKLCSPLVHPLKPSVDIDILRLEGASSFNAFTVQKVLPVTFESLDAGSPEEGTALYGLASFCNHSCLTSVIRAFYGDVITLRATRSIKEGEELTIEYLNGSSPLSVRDKLSRWKFRCNCDQCKADRADGTSACSLREKVLRELNTTAVSIEDAATKVNQIMNTYEDTPERRKCGSKPALAAAYHKYADELTKRAKRNRSYCIPAIEAEMKGLEAIGMKITDKSTSGPCKKQNRLPVDTTIGPTHDPERYAIVALHIVAAFDFLGDSHRARNWLRTSSWLSDINVGGGSRLFKLRYSSVLREMHIMHIVDGAF